MALNALAGMTAGGQLAWTARRQPSQQESVENRRKMMTTRGVAEAGRVRTKARAA